MSTLTCLVPFEFLVRLMPDCFAVFLQFEEPHLLPGGGANLDQLSAQQQELHVCVALQTCRKVTHKTSPIQNQNSGWCFPECTRPVCLVRLVFVIVRVLLSYREVQVTKVLKDCNLWQMHLKKLLRRTSASQIFLNRLLKGSSCKLWLNTVSDSGV